MEATTFKGKVKFLNETKGFGFIIEDEAQEDFFFHVSNLVDKVNRWDKVSFELKEGRKGPICINVKKIE